MTNNLTRLIKSSNGQCSVIFIYENLNSEEEQMLVIKTLDSFIYEAVWNPKFMRIAECIIGTFQPELIEPFISYIINNLRSFIKSRDGYFLLRTIAKNSKVTALHIAFVKQIKLCFPEFSNCTNGSLLLQCIVHNFALPNYKYIKSCSRHIANDSESDQNRSLVRSDNNPALSLLYDFITESARHWDNKNLRPVVECCIKIGGKQFENILVNGLEKHVKEFILSSYGISYAKLMFKYFESKNILKIVSLVNQYLKVHESNTAFLKWKNFFSEFNKNDITKLLIFEDISVSNTNTHERKQSDANKRNTQIFYNSPYLAIPNLMSVQPNLLVRNPNTMNNFYQTQQVLNLQTQNINFQHQLYNQHNYLRHTPLTPHTLINQNNIYMSSPYEFTPIQMHNAGNFQDLRLLTHKTGSASFNDKFKSKK